MTAVVIDLRTRERFQPPAYAPGLHGFLCFMEDRYGRNWYVSDRPKRVIACYGRNVPQRAYAAAQAEFRRLYGPIYHGEESA